MPDFDTACGLAMCVAALALLALGLYLDWREHKRSGWRATYPTHIER